MLRLLAVLTTAAVGALVLSGQAQAGFIVQPSDGLTTGPSPTFLVYLDSTDTLPLVYVSDSPQMTSYGSPAGNELGLCTPSTPFGEPNKFTCQPPGYAPSYGSTLAPGTYYWWMTYWASDGSLFGSQRISGPFKFTVVQPTAPANTYLLAPADGASLRGPITFRINAPGGATMHIYVGYDAIRADDGSPEGLTLYSCGGATTNAGPYYCTDTDTSLMIPGETYWWWAVINMPDGGNWVYGPRSFTFKDTTAVPPATPSAPKTQRVATDAPNLAAAADFTGGSVKDTRLSRAIYSVTKLIRSPKLIDVACWSDVDWPSVSGDSGDGIYTTLGFYTPLMPHWIELSPTVCRAMETLLHHRPVYPNRFMANAVETLTHESMHALGIRNEAMAECFGMQLSIFTAIRLGIPFGYADKLAKLNLINYASRPPNYQNYAACREGGKWDLLPRSPSWPWHTYSG